MITVIKVGSRLDFICLHYYFPNNDVVQFEGYIKGVENVCNLPAWATERVHVDERKVFNNRSRRCIPGRLYVGGGGNDERVGLC